MYMCACVYIHDCVCVYKRACFSSSVKVEDVEGEDGGCGCVHICICVCVRPICQDSSYSRKENNCGRH